MKTTPVSQLKATLSEQLARVKAGEEVVLLSRGGRLQKSSPSLVKQWVYRLICPNCPEKD